MKQSIRTEQDRQRAIALIHNADLPFTLSKTKGVQRSTDQNRLQRKWLLEAEEQGDCTSEEYRGYCKLHFGVPLMRAQCEDFCQKYDEIIKPLSYEQKLQLMQIPLDFPVTRFMTTKTKTDYLNQMYTHFLGLGFQLTEPMRAA